MTVGIGVASAMCPLWLRAEIGVGFSRSWKNICCAGGIEEGKMKITLDGVDVNGDAQSISVETTEIEWDGTIDSKFKLFRAVLLALPFSESTIHDYIIEWGHELMEMREVTNE